MVLPMRGGKTLRPLGAILPNSQKRCLSSTLSSIYLLLSGKAARLTRVIDKKDAKLIEETVAKAEDTPVAQEVKAAEADKKAE